MRKLLTILILILINSCSTPPGLVGRARMLVNEGMARDSTLELLGDPRRTTSFENLTLDQFCTTGGSYDDMVDVIYEGGVVLEVSTYTNSKTGFCTSFLRPRSLSSFKDKLVKDRLREANRKLTLAMEEERKLAERKRAALITSQEYFIDGLVILHTHDSGANCSSGGKYEIEVRGNIGPDSSFAIEELLRRSPNCLDEKGSVSSRTLIELESLGGLLKDGYLMGKAFRTYGVKTNITNSSACASSCAVAYLGGIERSMEKDSLIMFHSPYLPGLNTVGERIANCDVGSTTTTELLEYYQEMTSLEQGERLFDRTMSYCSAEDGWVLKGSAAAELFGVATQI